MGFASVVVRSRSVCIGLESVVCVVGLARQGGACATASAKPGQCWRRRVNSAASSRVVSAARRWLLQRLPGRRCRQAVQVTRSSKASATVAQLLTFGCVQLRGAQLACCGAVAPPVALGTLIPRGIAGFCCAVVAVVVAHFSGKLRSCVSLALQLRNFALSSSC